MNTRFKKGMVPWNKGLKGIHLSPSSEWKKGKVASHAKSKITKQCPICSNEFTVRNAFKKAECCSISCAQKLKWSRIIHPRWISDRSLLKDDSKSRGGQFHTEWSKQVKNRDYWKCQISNNDCSGRVEAHHILSWRSHPELRYKINNGITLCHFHHPRKRVDEEKLAPMFDALVRAKMQ